MTRLLLTLPLLAACAPLPRPCDVQICTPETGCICTGPTGSITATARDHDRAPRVAPEPEPEPDNEEPDSETDPEGYERWKEKQEAGL